MKRRRALLSATTVVLAVGLVIGFWATAGSTITRDKIADHSLFDQTSGDRGAVCAGTGPFEFHVAARAINGDAVMRIRFQDGDFVDYPIADNTSFSLVQAAGDTKGVDRRVAVISAPSSVGKLVGWVSAYRLPGTSGVGCTTLPQL
jgi:hypothetical protein